MAEPEDAALLDVRGVLEAMADPAGLEAEGEADLLRARMDILAAHGITSVQQLEDTIYAADRDDALRHFMITVAVYLPAFFGAIIQAVLDYNFRRGHMGSPSLIFTVLLTVFFSAYTITFIRLSTEAFAPKFNLPPLPRYGPPHFGYDIRYINLVTHPIGVVGYFKLLLTPISALNGLADSLLWIRPVLGLALTAIMACYTYFSLRSECTLVAFPYSNSGKRYRQSWLANPLTEDLHASLRYLKNPITALRCSFFAFARSLYSSMFRYAGMSLYHPSTTGRVCTLVPSIVCGYLRTVTTDWTRKLVWQCAYDLMEWGGLKNGMGLADQGLWEWMAERCTHGRLSPSSAERAGDVAQRRADQLVDFFRGKWAKKGLKDD